MDFSKFTPHQLRKAIEIELQGTDDVKVASIIALKRLNKDPLYYEDMTKATTHKYYKRIPKPSGKGYIYFYTKSDYDTYSKSKEPATTQKEGWISKIASLFNLKERNDVFLKVKADYERNKIKETYGLDWTGWKDHLSEYFIHKDKWDKFFTRIAPVGTGKDKTPTDKPGEKKTSGKKESRIKLSVMKAIFGLYGTAPATAPVTAPGTIASDYGFNYDISKNKSGNNEIIITRGSEKIGLLEYHKVENNYIEIDRLYLEDQYQRRGNGQKIISDILNAEKANGFTLYPLDPVPWLKMGMEYKNRDDKKYSEFVSITKKDFLEKNKNKLSPDNFDTMPESEKKETPEEKATDKKITSELNKATPENRNEIERKIMGIPEPTEEQMEDIIPKQIDFKPINTEIIIPFYPDNDNKFFAQDFTKVIAKDIFIVSEKDILEKEKPSYIPEINEKFFKDSKYFLPTMKLGENRYVVQTNKLTKYASFSSQPSTTSGENSYAIVTRDVLAAMQDYYLKKEKVKLKKYYDDYEKERGRKVKRTRVTIISKNSMSYSQSSIIKFFTGERVTNWDLYREIREDIRQKLEDMEIQLEEYYNTHAKGRETAYGDSGLKDNLLNEYGVKVKRQNGAEINDKEINEIKLAMDDLFSVFGNRSSMAKTFGLKISHSGDKLMHARKAAGLFFPSMKAIGVTAQSGQEGTGFILSHEWGHFMDYYLGDKKGKHYVSDDPEGIPGEIAGKFRKLMEKSQSSKYQNRTCECFARAMEQYWAIKTDNTDILSRWDSGNHPDNEIFKQAISPLIDKFLIENDVLLKAFFKRLNPVTAEFEYRRA